jgi:hypothetical protein
MGKNNTSSGGLGFGSILFLIFLVLKLTGSIDWSWWWVTSPLWIPFALILLVLGLSLLFDKIKPFD